MMLKNNVPAIIETTQAYIDSNMFHIDYIGNGYYGVLNGYGTGKTVVQGGFHTFSEADLWRWQFAWLCMIGVASQPLPFEVE